MFDVVKDFDPLVGSRAVLDPESLIEAIRGARLVPLQLGARPLPSSITRVVCPNVCLDLVTLGPAMLFTGAMPADCYTLSFVTECPGVGRSFNFTTDHTAGYMGFFPPGGMLDAYTPAGMSDAILTVPIKTFRNALDVYFPEIPGYVLARGAGMRVGAAVRAMLQRTLAAVSEAMRDPIAPLASEAARRQLEGNLLFSFISALRSGCESVVPAPKMKVAKRFESLRRARDFVRAHRNEALHIDDLAAELGLSARGIEYLFHDLLGVSPSVFLRHERLHGVHRDLVMANPRPGLVKEAALTWGFWHLGRFAHDYRMLFGECPSETLAHNESLFRNDGELWRELFHRGAHA